MPHFSISLCCSLIREELKTTKWHCFSLGKIGKIIHPQWVFLPPLCFLSLFPFIFWCGFVHILHKDELGKTGKSVSLPQAHWPRFESKCVGSYTPSLYLVIHLTTRPRRWTRSFQKQWGVSVKKGWAQINRPTSLFFKGNALENLIRHSVISYLPANGFMHAQCFCYGRTGNWEIVPDHAFLFLYWNGYFRVL